MLYAGGEEKVFEGALEVLYLSKFFLTIVEITTFTRIGGGLGRSEGAPLHTSLLETMPRFIAVKPQKPGITHQMLLTNILEENDCF